MPRRCGHGIRRRNAGRSPSPARQNPGPTAEWPAHRSLDDVTSPQGALVLIADGKGRVLLGGRPAQVSPVPGRAWASSGQTAWVGASRRFGRLRSRRVLGVSKQPSVRNSHRGESGGPSMPFRFRLASVLSRCRRGSCACAAVCGSNAWRSRGRSNTVPGIGEQSQNPVPGQRLGVGIRRCGRQVRRFAEVIGVDAEFAQARRTVR